ncbi:hypothetical protein F4861DRAFT_81268 [Xylaria intraflava]|nr:hypothetical protein F4861DRAFT_81268 [Xylaria intraflava]
MNQRQDPTEIRCPSHAVITVPPSIHDKHIIQNIPIKTGDKNVMYNLPTKNVGEIEITPVGRIYRWFASTRHKNRDTVFAQTLGPTVPDCHLHTSIGSLDVHNSNATAPNLPRRLPIAGTRKTWHPAWCRSKASDILHWLPCVIDVTEANISRKDKTTTGTKDSFNSCLAILTPNPTPLDDASPPLNTCASTIPVRNKSQARVTPPHTIPSSLSNASVITIGRKAKRQHPLTHFRNSGTQMGRSRC